MYARAVLATVAPLPVLIALLLPTAAAAQPFGVRLTHHDDPARSVAVGWNSPDNGDDEVHIGTAPGALDRVVTAADTHAIGDELATAFTARIDGLEPDTEYFYRVGNDGALHPAGEPFSFRTLPVDRCAPFRMVVIGDNRPDQDLVDTGPNPLWSRILEEALAETPQLFINTGDMVYDGSQKKQWADFIETSESGFAHVASIMTMGNHDEDDVNGDGAIYNRLFELPRNTRTATEDYYSTDVGPVHLVSLNTQFVRPGTTERDEMLEWLRADLAATRQPWKIVFFHKAVYTRGNHHTGEEHDGAINAALTPIFDEYDVDLVLNGHSHDYERYAPTVGFDEAFGGTGRTFPAGIGSDLAAMTSLPDGRTGTSYIVTGGAGALTTAGIPGTDFCMDLACTYCLPLVNMCDEDVLAKDREGTVMFSGLHNYLILDVDGPTLTGEAWATVAGNSGRGGKTLDRFTISHSDWSDGFCGTGPTPGEDAGVPGFDAGVPPNHDAGGATGAGDAGRGGADATAGSDDGGCGCHVPGHRSHLPVPLGLLGLLLLVLWRRRS